MLHLGEFLEEAGLHGPILEVVRVLEEDPGHLVAVVLGIKGKYVSVGEGPVEVEVLDKGGAEDARRGVFLVLKHQTVSQPRPDQKVNHSGMLDSLLRRSEIVSALPLSISARQRIK